MHRIYRFKTYKLQRLPLAALNGDELAIDDALVATYAQRSEQAPPIIYDPVAQSIIDGSHRVKAAKMRGEDTIAAYVGARIDPDWSDDEDEDEED